MIFFHVYLYVKKMDIKDLAIKKNNLKKNTKKNNYLEVQPPVPEYQ